MTDEQSRMISELREALPIFFWPSEQAERVGTIYRGPADFILQHGEEFEPQALPEEYEYGAPKLCFANALILAATSGLVYVQGYAFGPFGLPIPHAWNVDAEGGLVDTTWQSEETDSGLRVPMPGSAYLGVRFSVGRADDALWNGDADVVDDWQRRWPLLREPWTGEDFEREWEPTEALRTIRKVLV